MYNFSAVIPDIQSITYTTVQDLAKFDKVFVSTYAWDLYPSFSKNLRALNSNIEIFLTLSISAGPESGFVSSSDTIGYAIMQRLYNNNQYLLTTGGDPLPISTDSTYTQTGYVGMDLTSYCPVATGDSKNFRDWYADYIATGIMARYDIDGILLEDVDNDNSRFFYNITYSDINRDGSYEAIGTTWSGGQSAFLTRLRKNIVSNGLIGKKIYFSGPYTKYTDFDGYVEHNAYGNHADLKTAVDFYNGLVDSGVTVVMSAQIPPAETGYRIPAYTALSHIYDISVAISTGEYELRHLGERNTYLQPTTRFRGSVLTTGISDAGTIVWSAYKKGMTALSLDTSSASWENITFYPESGGIFWRELKRDYSYEFGFSGLRGSGVGRKMNHILEKVRVDILNKMEHAIQKIYDDSEDGYGRFGANASDTVYFQMYHADGTTTGFDLQKGVNRWDLLGIEHIYDGGFDGKGDNYSSSDPNPNFSRLAEYDADTGLFRRLEFTEAPASGWHFLFYKPSRGSMLNSAAFLDSNS